MSKQSASLHEFKVPDPVSELRALVVDEVNEDDLLRGAAQGKATGPDLPTRLISLPVDDLSQIAVLSWRWDMEHQVQSSRNVASAIRQAKLMGVRHLFIDTVSIDQELRGDALLEQVVAFSTLFQTVPVIAAYDRLGDDFRKTMRRPWILSEARAFRSNPNRIVYVGHNNQGATRDPLFASTYTGSSLLGELSLYEFGDMIERIWRSSFTHTILSVLCEEVGMYSVSDFKFIMPAYARVLTAACEQMSRNDYLLTAAILCNVHRRDSKVNASADIAPVKFDRYTRDAAPGGSYDTNEDIFLDGTKVATWLHHYNLATSNHHCRLETLPDAERVIFAALGLSESEYREYAAQEEKRRASLLIDYQGAAPLPKLEVASVVL